MAHISHSIPVRPLSRRSFLGAAAGGLLIGNAFVRGTGHAAVVETPDSDRVQSLFIRTHEFYGDIEERIDLPRDWQVTVAHMPGNGLPVLGQDELRARLADPTSTPPLREIAAGKRTAMVLFDDITRFTPVHDVATLVVEELIAAGIREEHIRFLCCIGTHRGATNDEMRRKLGSAIVDRFTWFNHNCFERCADLGTTASGNKIRPNFYLTTADVKVSINGLKNHANPGYSGGAKIILPGCSHIDSIEHMHRLPGRSGAIYHNDCRADMEETARRTGLDFTVNLAVNGSRQIIGLFAGDIGDAWRRGVETAVPWYNTVPIPGADVVIANPYPRNMQDAVTFHWRESLREGGTYVEICQMPLGRYTTHYLNDRNSFPTGSWGENLTVEQPKPIDPLPQAGQILVFSQYLQHRDLRLYDPKRVVLCRSWDDVLTRLAARHGPSTHAVLYPYGGVQHTPVELDRP